MSEQPTPSEPDAPPQPPQHGRQQAAQVVPALESFVAEQKVEWNSVTFGLPLRIWEVIVLVLLIASADICLYEHAGGTGGGMLMLIAALGLISARQNGWQLSNRSLLLTILLISLMCAWNCMWLAVFVGVLAVSAFAIKLHQPQWSITEVVWSMPWMAAWAPFRLIGHALRVLGYGANSGGKLEPSRRRRLRVVLIPLIVTIAFILIFIAANPVIEKFVGDLSRWLDKWLKEFFGLFTISRMMSWLGWGLVFAVLLRPHIRSWTAQWMAKRSEVLEPPAASEESGDFATAEATLICVNLVFLAFNALDAVYLYFKAELPEGITFSQYSHRGCVWLTFALILSTGIIGLIFRHRLSFHPRTRMLKVWAYMWAAQNFILALGALRRLQMYIDYNGMTRMRIVGIYGIILVVAGLVLMIAKVRHAKNILWLVRRDLLAFWIALIVLALTPRDLIAWRYNVAQAMGGNLRPLANLTVQRMSAEAYPMLIPLLDHPEEWVRKGTAAILSVHLAELEFRKPKHWTEWQGSWQWAYARLNAQKERTSTMLPQSEWPKAQQLLFEKVSPWVHYDRNWK